MPVTIYTGYVSTTRGVRLQALTGESFWFDPGALCLEFALTGGLGRWAAYEQLHSPSDLAQWFSTSLGFDGTVVGKRDLRAARGLREAIWQVADARAAGEPLPPRAARLINRRASAGPPVPQINAWGRRGWAEPVTVRRLLGLLARDAVEVFGGPLANRIRRCTGTNCTLIFADASPSGRRRWCSMERCGNRAKVRGFRSRKQEATARRCPQPSST